VRKEVEVMSGNIVIGQSGGPTAVINASLAGVIKGAKAMGANKIYGMRYGIQGFIDELLIDLSDYVRDDMDIELLKRTPAAFLGSCRFKLPELDTHDEVYSRIFKTIEKYEIECFIYIGGNDSMDTIRKLSDYALKIGNKTKFVGAPKTIDNDLAITDHTPGYGSAAKYIATSIKEIIRDGLSVSYGTRTVLVCEIMGRNAGWLTAASVLSKGEDCDGPDLVYLPETVFDPDDFIMRLRELLTKKSFICVCLSEGIKLADGRYVCELGTSSDYVDAFGHKQLTGTSAVLAAKIAAEIGVKARSIELSTLQRAASHISSKTDIREAFESGFAAAKAAYNGESGKMILLKRVSNTPYEFATDIYDIHFISNIEKTVPKEWITEEGTYISDEFVNYAKPLIEGELLPIYVDGVPRHLVLPKNV